MNTLEKLEQAAQLLESAYYDLNRCDKINLCLVRKVSVAEDLTLSAIEEMKGM